MSSLDALFEPDRTESPPPEARRWESLRQGRRLVCEFLRRRQGLSWEPARLQVSLPDASPPVIELPVPWELRLDDWLLAHGAKAPSEKNEAERFGFRFHPAFEPIEERYGGGYFNAVLWLYLEETFKQYRKVREKLEAVHTVSTSIEGAGECWEQIDSVVASVARTLTCQLGYERPKAESILSEAVAYYLDERFNVSTRKLLGFT